MKFCPSCKRVYDDKQSKCQKCNKNLKEITDINEPVSIAVVGGTERAMFIGLLNDNDIPFVEQHIAKEGLTNDLVTGYDVKLSNINILVPYSSVPKVFDLAKGIDVNVEKVEPLLDSINSDIEKMKNKKIETVEMDPKKRTIIRILSAILFLIIVALVVFGTDYITGLFKGLFGGTL